MSFDFTVRVTMTARAGGKTIAESYAEDTATLTLKRQESVVAAQIGGSGSFEVRTQTATN